ncbi:peptide-methionine (R)-S-oxide reductase [Flavobacteriales bacterium 34_180_T64]|nr:peptide-methionine (R)-S-oxide reductase [Flavobacteriales bacterium 34_180_T64]
MKRTLFLCLSILLFSCNTNAQKVNTTPEKKYTISKTDAEWKLILSPEQYYILRQAGTERAFSSPLNKNDAIGTYHCAACNTPLFKSEYKYDSGSGWPSFDREIKGNVAYGSDTNLGYSRDEEHCATCGGHLGHLFNDGPSDTTGKRHCINGDALIFVPKTN